jgi:signal transduction histidine kinase
LLTAALREAAALANASLVVLRWPEASGPLELRYPPDATWPPPRLVQRWQAGLIHRKQPVVLSARDCPPATRLRSGIVLPVFSAAGIGVLGVVRTRRARLSPNESAALMVLANQAVTRAEAARLRQQTEAETASDVHERVARELHDGPLQLMSAIMLHLRLLRAADARADAFGGLETEMEQAIRQMRALIRHLRVSHPEASLQDRVREALTRLEQAHGLSWSMEWNEPEGLLQDVVADELFQVINEALANVYRHSSAKRVEVRSRVAGEVFEVTVRDDGVGFDVAQALRLDARRLSFGLISMQERVSALGGVLTLRSQPGRGTRVLISLPLGRLEVSKGA